MPRQPARRFSALHRPLRLEGLESRELLAAAPVDASPIDLGQVDYLERAGLNPAAGDVWLELEATHYGFLTAVASASKPVSLALYDINFEQIAVSRSEGGAERLDLRDASAQGTYYLRMAGEARSVGLVLVNLVDVDEDFTQTLVTVQGTAGNDSFTFIAQDATGGSGGSTVSVQGVDYRFQPTVKTTPISLDVTPFQVEFVGGAGTDGLFIQGTRGDETVSLAPGEGTVSGPRYKVSLTEIEQVQVAGNGGYDSAALTDSRGDDEYVGTPRTAELSGRGFSMVLEDFDFVNVVSRGGSDTARLHGSPQADEFIGRADYSKLSGEGYLHRVKYFDFVHALGHGGLGDVATLFDSEGNDTFVATPEYAKMSSDAFFVRARDFARATGRSVNGGADLAILHDSVGDDLLLANEAYATISTDAMRLHAAGFSQVTALSYRGGHDVKRIGRLDFALTLVGPWENV